jgi:uncharacterized protein YhbP (UPF0306 family)
MSYPEYIPSGISKFINENKIAAICCTDGNNQPYCFHCFYVFDATNNLLFFKSSEKTFHASLLAKNPAIAGSILPQKMEMLALKGIQFTGTVLYSDFPNQINPDIYYHKKLPLGLAKPGHVYCIQLQTIKMTDNTILFGTQLLWNKSELV